MHGLLASFYPLYTRYKSEVILLGAAFLICITSVILFFQQKSEIEHDPIPVIESNTHTAHTQQTITVDISGAVTHPFVYSFDRSARIVDAIQKAGGLTEEADKAFVYRNVNYARIMSDQEKIYIPFIADTTNGVILENKRILDYTQPNVSNSARDASTTRININSASVLELDQLPGVGKVTAEAIISARPYTDPEELVKNAIIKQSVFDKIKDLISVY